MPGIVGFIGAGHPEENASVLDRMVKSMTYESFYTTGTYVNERMGLWIGWVNHQHSLSDCMPIWNRKKDTCLVFSGEDFRDPNEIESIRRKDHDFVRENASYLEHLYEEIGLKFIDKLNGWFSGLIVDLRRQHIVLFNDRYGMNRIFIHEGKGGFYFSSEAKALLSVLPVAREFDPVGLGEFLTCGCTLESRSLYKGINILPPGALWTVDHREITNRGSYFDLKEWASQENLDEKRFSDNIVNSFGELVKRYTGGKLPVGISLTGGLDSRMVMAGLNPQPDEFPCYTFGSMYRDTFDVKVGREVAKTCNQPHKILVLDEEFLNELPYYLEKAVYISDGYIGLSGAAELYGNSLARNIAPVRLTGNYGGELLRAVRGFKYQVPKGGFISPDLHPFLEATKSTFQDLEATDPVTFALFRQAPLQGYGRLAIEKSQVIMRTPFMDNDLVKLVYQAPPRLLKNEELSVAIISRYNSDLLKIPTDRGLLGGGSRLGCRIRQLHREILFKSEYLASHGMPNWLAAISHFGINDILERSFLGRHKFQHFRLWSQKHFAGYITDVLLQGAEELKAFFDWHRIEKLLQAHLAGKQNYINEIDKIMTLAQTHKAFFKDRLPR